MKIVGTHDELMMLKLTCQKHSDCNLCVLKPFCELSGVQEKGLLDVLTIEKIKTIAIGGDSHER